MEAKTKEEVVEEIYGRQVTVSNLMLRAMDKWGEIYATQLKEENQRLREALERAIVEFKKPHTILSREKNVINILSEALSNNQIKET